MTEKDDTIGRRVGDLKVQFALGRNHRGKKLYGCKCSCGNESTVVMTKKEIDDGRFTSCGHDGGGSGEDDEFPF